MAGRFAQYTATVTTDAAGAGTALLGPSGDASETNRPASKENGEVYSVAYTKVDFDNGVTFTITTATGGLTVWSEAAVNASKTVYPRPAVNSTAGAALLYAGGGEAVPDLRGVPLVDEQLSVVVASGGNVKTGTFTLTVRR